MGEHEVSNEQMDTLLPDVLAAFLAGDVDCRVVVVFEVGPTGCFKETPVEDDGCAAVDAEGVCGLDGVPGSVDDTH